MVIHINSSAVVGGPIHISNSDVFGHHQFHLEDIQQDARATHFCNHLKITENLVFLANLAVMKCAYCISSILLALQISYSSWIQRILHKIDDSC